MARPEPQILNQATAETGNEWQILAAEAYYVITYQGRAINLRVVTYTLEGPEYKYKKLTYANIGNAARQVQLLNKRFNCEDFDLVEVEM